MAACEQLGRGPLPPDAAAGRGAAALGQKLETQRARDRRRLDQTHPDAVTQTVGFAAAVADQGMAILVIAKIIRSYGARRYESVGAGVVELHEQAGTGGARNMALES